MNQAYDVQQSSVFVRWLQRLRDLRAQALIDVRILRLAHGNLGDVKSLGGGLHELRIDYGPGYRVYFTYFGQRIVVLLAGGDKRTQIRDIQAARQIADEWRRRHGG